MRSVGHRGGTVRARRGSRGGRATIPPNRRSGHGRHGLGQTVDRPDANLPVGAGTNGDHVGRAQPRVYADMGPQVDPRHRHSHHRAGGILDGYERAAQGHHRAMVLGISVQVEKGVAGRFGQGGDDQRIAALADVDDAFGEKGAVESGRRGPRSQTATA